MKTKTSPLVLVSTFLILLCISCKTQNSVPQTLFAMQFPNQELFLNDSITQIISNPLEIQCNLISQNPLDTVRTKDSCEVPSKLIPVVSFLVSDPSNFEANDMVYGVFTPSAQYIFKDKKNNKVYIDLDFGLKKMRISDNNGEVVLLSDMPITSQQLFRITRLVFPDDETLKLRTLNQ